MQWIEQMLHISPDGGDGTFEFAIFLALVTVAGFSITSLRRFARRRNFGRGGRSDDGGQASGN
jgi:hypothetical protein